VKIYVASSFDRKVDVKRVQAKLIEMGHTISHDWTFESTENRPIDQMETYLQRCAYDDWSGVVNADVLLLLNDPKGFGAMVELGMGIAYGKRIMVVEPHQRDCIFFKTVEVEKFYTLSAALEAL
jgi:hypothetical protein